MKRALACCLALAACGDEPRERADGSYVHVFFEERHGIEDVKRDLAEIDWSLEEQALRKRAG